MIVQKDSKETKLKAQSLYYDVPLSLTGKHLRNPIQSWLLAEFRNLVS